MATTHEIEGGRRIDLAREVVGLGRSDRRARLVEQTGGPPQRIDGLTVGHPSSPATPRTTARCTPMATSCST
jgi:hypothetical protein